MRKKNGRKRIERRKSWREGVEGHTEDCWSGEKRKSSGIEKGCSSSFPLSLSLFSLSLSLSSPQKKSLIRERERGCKDTGGQFGGKLQKDNVQKVPLIFLFLLSSLSLSLFSFSTILDEDFVCPFRVGEGSPGFLRLPPPLYFFNFSLSPFLRGKERDREIERKRGSINPDRGQLTCSVNLFPMLQVHVIPFQGFFTCFKLPLPLTPKNSQFPYTLGRWENSLGSKWES